MLFIITHFEGVKIMVLIENKKSTFSFILSRTLTLSLSLSLSLRF